MDSLKSLLSEGDSLAKLGSLFDGDADEAATAVDAAGPALIAGLADEGSADGAALTEQLDAADTSILDEVDGFLDGGDSEAGVGIVDSIFGDGRDDVVDGLASESGLSTDAFMKVLPMLAPLVTGTLAKRRSDDELDTDGVVELLSTEKEDLESDGKLGGWFDKLAVGSALGAAGAASAGLASAASDAGSAASDTTDATADAAGNAAGDAGDAASDAKAAGEDAAEDAGDAASDVEDAASDAEDAASDGKDAADDAASDAEDAALDAKDAVAVAAGGAGAAALAGDSPDADDASTDAKDAADDGDEDEAKDDDDEASDTAAAGTAGTAAATTNLTDIKDDDQDRRGGLGWLWWALGAVLVVLLLAWLLNQFGDDDSTSTDDAGTTATTAEETTTSAAEETTSSESEATTTTESEATTTVEETTTSDGGAGGELQTAVDTALADAGITGVTATVDGDVVTLTGTVDSEEAKAAAQAAVEAVEGVGSVDNQLTVEEGDSDGAGPGGDGDTLNAELGLEPITFAYRSAAIAPAGEAVLDEVVAYLAANGDVNVEIQGHTDSDGTEAENLDLSTRRAESVKVYLEGAGIDAARMTTVGYGESAPKVPNDSAVNKETNRRIEFVVVS